MSSPAPPVTTTRTTIALEPVRRTLLDDARRAAGEIVAEAQRRAEQIVDDARSEADEALGEARRRAEASAAAQAEQTLARDRRAAYSNVLRTRDELRRELTDRVRSAAVDLRHDPRYPALLDQLEQLAREQLGGEIEIERDPQPGGGIVATAGGRRVDYRLAALADRAVNAIADEVVKLWS